MMYYESRGESISGLLKQQWPVPIQPVKAIDIKLRNHIDRTGPDTTCTFEINFSNVSEGEIALSNFAFSLDSRSQYKTDIIEPEDKSINLNFGESYAMIIGLTKSNNIIDSGRALMIGTVSFNYSLLNRDNDKGFLDLKLEKPNEELKLLNLIPCKKSDLAIKYQSVNEIRFLLANNNDKNFIIRIDKNHKDTSAIGIHKIIVDAPINGSANYELKAGDFIEVRTIVFAKARGTFPFDFIKIYGLINRQTTLIEYSAPDIIVE